MKAAVYCGTRNLYKQMVHAAKSLLKYSDVDKIYFIIEDDEFPYELPPEIECKNLSNQTYFRPNGPNYNENLCLTWMVLIRAALPKIFPDLDRILTLDVDTLVRDNISHMWDIDLDGYYLAATKEEALSKEENRDYINMGMAMINLKKWREDKMDDKIIAALDKYFYRYNEQDCINDFCEGKIKILPSDYNCCWQAKRPSHERIMHFAGVGDWMKWSYFHVYDNIPFEAIERNQNFKINLDIIILTYKNKDALRKTLNSINVMTRHSNNIIVINNGDSDDYSDILKEYPFINYHYLQTKIGFSAARQYALDNSNSSYFTFLDAGNTFIPGADKAILNYIKNNIFFDLYHWNYRTNDNKKAKEYENNLLGYVFRREFIEARNIHFNDTDDYFGFIRSCRLILEYYKHSRIIRDHYDNMIMFKENNNYSYVTPISHAQNGIDAIEMTIYAHISPYHILIPCASVMLDLYYEFIKAYEEDPIILEDCWQAARYFWENCYDIYKLVGTKGAMKLYQKEYLPKIVQGIIWNIPYSPNFSRFLHELEDNKTLPKRYLS